MPPLSHLWVVGHLHGDTHLYHTPQDCAAGTMPVASIPGGTRVRVHYPWKEHEGIVCVPIAYCERDTGRPLFNYVQKDAFDYFEPL